MDVDPTSPAGTAASLDLYWIPLGAGGPAIVRASGRLYEAGHALLRGHPRHDLYHVALIATTADEPTVVEVAPVPDDRGREVRGVVGEGAVGSRLLGSLRLFRYEVRRWTGGVVPDLGDAVASPVCITQDHDRVAHALDLVAQVPTPVWGRDELGVGDMWNSNSVASWVLARSGLLERAGDPPPGGRAPGWAAGIEVARSSSELSPRPRRRARARPRSDRPG